MNYTDPRLVSTQDIHQQVVTNLVRLIRKLESGGDPSGDLPQVHQLLEVLPMATGEFGLAINRLKNANRYLQSCERGAARWELALLLDGLRKEIVAATVQPRLRKQRSDPLNGSIKPDDDTDTMPVIVGWLIALLVVGACMTFLLH
jgi:hypothetical protein